DAVPARFGVAQHSAGNVERGLARTLCAAEPGDLRLGLAPPAVLKEVAVDTNVDSVRAQMVCELEREAGRHDGLRHSELTERARVHLERRLDGRGTGAQQLVDPELLGRKRLDVGRGSLQTLALERGDDDEAAPVALDVQERIGDPERHFMPHRGGAGRICVDEDVGHANDPRSRPSRSSRTPTIAPVTAGWRRTKRIAPAVTLPVSPRSSARRSVRSSDANGCVRRKSPSSSASTSKPSVRNPLASGDHTITPSERASASGRISSSTSRTSALY